MIFHNKYLAITDIDEMGQYSFDNLEGWKDYAKKSEPGDIIITGKNFGAGSSRQQAVDCFKSLKNQIIIAESLEIVCSIQIKETNNIIEIFKDFLFLIC